MIYSYLYLKNQAKIPSVVVIIFLLIGIIFFSRLFAKNPVPSKAEKKTLKRLEITNISPNQATIYWQTDKKDVGSVLFGEDSNKLTRLAYDERDLELKKTQYFNHYVVLRNLKAGKKYFFKLISDNKILLNNENEGYIFRTPDINNQFKGRDPVYGKVIEANGLPFKDAIVLIRVKNSFPVTTLTKETGEWLVSLNNLYEKDTYKQIVLGNKENISIEIISDKKTSKIVSDISQTSPLPQSIIIGNDYNFNTVDNVLSATSSYLDNKSSKKEIDILYPKEESIIPGLNPLIKGIALPNSIVNISVQSANEIAARIKTDDKGIWTFQLPSSLSPGEHLITVKTVDKEGKDVTIKRKFTIAKNGEQVLGSATNSGLNPVVQNSPTPTVQIYLTPTIINRNSPTITPPVSGISIVIPVITAASLIIIGTGLMLVF